MSSNNAQRASSKNVGASKKIAGSSSSRARASKNDPNASHSRLVGASSKVAGSSMHAGGGGGQSTQVYLDGVNVTPQSLLFTRVKTASDKQAAAAGRAKTKKADDGGNASAANAGVSSANLAPHSSSSVLSDSDGSSSAGGESGQNLDMLLAGAMTAKAPPSAKKPLEVAAMIVPPDDGDGDGLAGMDDGNMDMATMKQPKSDRATTGDASGPPDVKFQGPVTIHFTETPTIMLFEWKGICVGQDTPEHGVVVAKNKKYIEMCASKKGSDNYIENRTQTLQLAQKTKEVMTAPPATRDAACVATDWDIFDADQAELDNAGNDHDEMDATAAGGGGGKSKAAQDAENVDAQLVKQVDEIVKASVASPGCLLLADGAELLSDLKARQRALQTMARTKHAPAHASHHSSTANDSKANHSRASRLLQSSTQSIPRGSTANVATSSASVTSSGNGGSSANVNASANVNTSATDINNSSSGDAAGSHTDISRSSTNSDGANSTDGGKTVNAYSTANTNVDIGDIIAEHKTQAVLASASLLKMLRILERAVQQNFYHTRHLLYRNFPLLTTNNNAPPLMGHQSSQPNVFDKSNDLEKLWSFKCALTQGRTVSCLAWNPVNDDLLAVSYGQFDAADDTQDGLVLFWSLKNPEYPERIYTLGCGVTSIDFSRMHPNLLAVGFHNGVVALFDTRKEGNEPVLSSETNSGSHLDVVWQVKWVHKGSERGESIVSIASDGRVTEWSMKKGLSYSDLMTLKRVPNPLMGSEARIDGVIARQASGNCIEFAQNDSSVYFVGTEDGNIHKCSVSYNEQYLETYYGHTAAVYAIHMSPFWSQLLLSCSADWTVKLWHQADQHEILNFRSVDLSNGVHGIGWCPNDSTIFGSVTEDGRIEIWDLSTSVLDPIITHFPKEDVECTCISFAPSSPVLVVGDSTGDVGVFRVPVLAEGRCDGMSVDDQIDRLKHAIQPHRGE
ncbi:Aste57867_19354 [Aphanomyces stellatus]|uniref:Dynein axonemal intermediate chain 4 n=1 Tax=Aphanomyces stellatus TaxID=120398 RepID=A0A485LD41_9STRA|nr:hypothetical protein As57867_019290 [Aphanomyces stellatus]VFT96068.1 Aste57867_19354 [Aphanomyces stellatus]